MAKKRASLNFKKVTSDSKNSIRGTSFDEIFARSEKGDKWTLGETVTVNDSRLNRTRKLRTNNLPDDVAEGLKRAMNSPQLKAIQKLAEQAKSMIPEGEDDLETFVRRMSEIAEKNNNGELNDIRL